MRLSTVFLFVTLFFVACVGLIFGFIRPQAEQKKVSNINGRDQLYNLTEEKLNDLVATDYWDHTNSDKCDWQCRLKRSKIKGSYEWIGENLWRNEIEQGCSIEKAIKAWHKSPTHHENLVHSYDREVMLTGSNESYCYIVQIRMESK